MALKRGIFYLKLPAQWITGLVLAKFTWNQLLFENCNVFFQLSLIQLTLPRSPVQVLISKLQRMGDQSLFQGLLSYTSQSNFTIFRFLSPCHPGVQTWATQFHCAELSDRWNCAVVSLVPRGGLPAVHNALDPNTAVTKPKAFLGCIKQGICLQRQGAVNTMVQSIGRSSFEILVQWWLPLAKKKVNLNWNKCREGLLAFSILLILLFYKERWKDLGLFSIVKWRQGKGCDYSFIGAFKE